MSEIPEYRSICLRTDEDITRLTSLASTCIKDAQYLPTLNLLTFDRPFRRTWQDAAGSEDNPTVTGEHLLTEYVRSLHLPEDTSEEVLDAVVWRNHLKDSEGSSAQHGPSTYSDSDAHAVATVILSLATNLETLRLAEPRWNSPVHVFLKRNNYSMLSRLFFQNLKHIHLAANKGDVGTDPRFYEQMNLFEVLTCFHRLPNLESITIDAITENVEEETILYPHLSQVRHISVTQSCLSSLYIAALIRLPKPNHLECFRYTIGGRAELNGHGMVYPKTIGKALETQKLSLKVLEFDMDGHVSARPDGWGDNEAWQDDQYPSDEDEEDDQDQDQDEYLLMDKEESQFPLNPWELPDTKDYGDTIGSLADFVKLGSLKIGVRLLLGPDNHVLNSDPLILGPKPPPVRLISVLPPSLKRFTLLGYQRGQYAMIDNMVDEFLRLKDVKLPLLTDVSGIDQMTESNRSFRHADQDADIMWKGSQWEGQWKLV